MARLEDQDLLRAASSALDELTRRDRDTLEQAILDHKPIEEIARASLISIERAAFWMEGARTQFRDKLHLQLDRLGEPELSPTEVLDVLAAALRLTRNPPVVKLAHPAQVVACPKCGGRFHDRDGQLATYARLAAEGRIGLLIGCTACSLLFVP